MEKESMINSILVKQLRKEAGWSQEQFARVSGLSLRTIQRIEAEGKASMETKLCLAATLQIKLEELELTSPESHEVTVSTNSQFNNAFLTLVFITVIISITGFIFELPKPMTFVANFTALFGLIFGAFKLYFSGTKTTSSNLKPAFAGGFICVSLFSLFSLFSEHSDAYVVPMFTTLILFGLFTLIVKAKKKLSL